MHRTDQFPGGPLETVRCDLCGSANDRTVLTISDVLMGTTSQVFRIAQCRRCDLIYLNPRPPAGSMPTYYPEEYSPFKRSGLSGAARNWLYRRAVDHLGPLAARPNRVLDVGCGSGELLRAVRAAGNSNVLGIEPSRQAASIARDRYGLPVIDGTLESTSLESHSVDTILMSHVLEHLSSPTATIEEVGRVLKPGGALVLWIPNAHSLAARWLGPYWMGWDVPRHLYAFTPATVDRLLSNANFMIADISHEWHGLEWAWGLRLWARSRLRLTGAGRLFGPLHPILAAGLSPLGILSSTLEQSGRIQIIARKPLD